MLPLSRRPALLRIFLVVFCFAAASVAYALLAPKWYRSALTVVAAKSQRPGVSSLLGGDLASLASGFDSSLGGADVQRIAAVLQSVSLTDAVIEHFDLKQRYHKTYQEYARSALWEHCEVRVLTKPGFVQLSCEDEDPRFAQQMLEFFAERGNAVFRRVNESSASEEVRFLERRVAQLRASADQTAVSMREFQERHGVFDLDSQSKALVSALSTLNAQRINKQLEFDFARTFSAGDESSLQQLSSQLSIMDRKMRDLQLSPESGGSERPGTARNGRGAGGVFPPALEVPKLRAEFETLYRERKVAEATLVFGLERLEAARANEARDTSTFVVLDPPTLPTRHSRPKRPNIVIACTLLGGLFALALEWVRKVGGVSPAVGVLVQLVRRGSSR